MKTSFPYGSFLKRSYFLLLSFRDLQILFPKILFEFKVPVISSDYLTLIVMLK